MYQVRPSKVELDLMASLIPGGDTWNWDNMFAAMKKGENFTAPSTEVQTEADIEFAAASHGTSGPLHVSYPGLCVDAFLRVVYLSNCCLLSQHRPGRR